METLRIALIGNTGVGKSTLGNTLLGEKKFTTSAACKSVTLRCQKEKGNLPSGRKVKVVDTPGLMDIKGRDVRKEIQKCVGLLKPGPHAFIIVLQPVRMTSEETRVLRLINELFDDRSFLEHTILVMTKKADITDDVENPIDIQRFMETMVSDDLKQLYRQCGERIVAIENIRSTIKEKNKSRLEIIDDIMALDDFYSYKHFKQMRDKNR